MEEAMRQEIQRTRDPYTGTVPMERLQEARSVQLQRFAQQFATRTPSAVPGIAWSERGPDNVGGRTRAILFDISDATYKKVWAGGVGGGLWYTNDITAGTPAWTKVNDQFDNLAVTCISQHPFTDSAQFMYFGTGEGWYNADSIRGNGIYKTINGGATWTQLPSTINNPDFYSVQDIKVVCCGVGPAVVATTRRGGIQRSTDGGAHWSKVLGNGVGGGNTDEGSDLEFVYNYIYATMGIHTGGGGIYRSDDGGATWKLLYSSGAGEGRIVVANNANRYPHMYALVTENIGDNSPIKKIMKITNADDDPSNIIGAWTTVTNPPRCSLGVMSSDFTGGQGDYDLTLAIDPKDPFNSNTVYIGGIELYKTTDGGGNWNQLSSWASGYCGRPYVHADMHQILFRPNYNPISGPALDILFACDGGIFRTTDGGTSFTNRNKTYNVTQFYSCAMHPTNVNYFLGGTQDNGTQMFNSAGMNSTTEASGGDGGFCHIDQDHPDTQITAYIYNAYFVSTDGGATFPDYRFDGTGGSFINPTDYDNSLNVLYGGATAGEYFRWQSPPDTSAGHVVTQGVGNFNFGTVTHVKVSPLTANRVYFGLDNGSVVRVDNANSSPIVTTIIKNGGAPSESVSCIAIDPGNEAHMLVTYFNYGVASVFESMNATAATPTWASVEGNLPDMPVRWAIFDPRNSDWAILATEKGIWSTDDLNSGGVTDWQPTNNNFANTRVDMLKYRASDRTLIAATHGRGLFSTTIPAGPPLPIFLLEFTGHLQGNEIGLAWQTSFEKNSRGFEIEKSTDGSRFNKIGFVSAIGNSVINRSYSFHDKDIAQEKNYYRLKLIDIDGKSEYSKTILIKNTFIVKSIFQVIGNPFKNSLDLQFGNISGNSGEVRLIDMAGKTIMRWIININPNSRMRLDLTGRNLSGGVYTVQMLVGNQKYSLRVMRE
jgi:photosystem II stability/assembly factor-like uncharacterized protein